MNQQLNSNDVLFARGKGADDNGGNKIYRQIVKEYKLIYHAARSHREKKLIAQGIINTINSRGGRFLHQPPSAHGFQWYLLSYDAVLKKVKQALREKKKNLPDDCNNNNNNNNDDDEKGIDHEVLQGEGEHIIKEIIQKTAPNSLLPEYMTNCEQMGRQSISLNPYGVYDNHSFEPIKQLSMDDEETLKGGFGDMRIDYVISHPIPLSAPCHPHRSSAQSPNTGDNGMANETWTDEEYSYPLADDLSSCMSTDDILVGDEIHNFDFDASLTSLDNWLKSKL
jgi:hypothetical protein